MDGQPLEDLDARPPLEEPAEPELQAVGGDGDPSPAADPSPAPRERPQNPRHVRGVPTTAEVKVERALELFNASQHQRMMAGLTRSLGQPLATEVQDPDAPSTVTVLVAWELSWYRYRVDLGDAAEPVALHGQGDELSDIDDALRNWNAGLDADGRVVIAVKPG